MPKISISSASDGETRAPIYSQPAKVLACDKCAATKIAKSHAKSLDGLFMQFVPKRPYRCLHCYNRFWEWESFFASRKRVISWAVLLSALLLLYLWQGDRSPKEVDIGPFYQADDGLNQPPVVDPNKPAASRPTSREDEASVQASQRRRPAEQKPSPAQLRKARAEVEQVKQLNEKKRALLEQSIQAQRSELESLLKVEVGYVVESWRKAWQAGDVERYLSFYSSAFKPRNDQALLDWQAQRRQRVTAGKQISLELTNFAVSFNKQHTRVVVAFDQSYQAGNYQNKTRKQLVLLKEQQEWKIIAETEIN